MRARIILITLSIFSFAGPTVYGAEQEAGISRCIASEAREVTIVDAWVRPAIVPGRPAAGYMTICNGSNQDDRLLSVEGPDGTRIEAHETRSENGVMNMARLDDVFVAAGGEKEFSPGKLHLMIFGLTTDLIPEDGSELLMRFNFEHAGTIEVRAQLLRRPKDHEHH